jgi:predicted chitinase
LRHLTDACELYDIRGPVRVAAFLAQVGHESGSFKHTSEVWGPTEAQKRYERNFDAPWPATREDARKPQFALNRLAFSLGNTLQFGI